MHVLRGVNSCVRRNAVPAGEGQVDCHSGTLDRCQGLMTNTLNCLLTSSANSILYKKPTYRNRRTIKKMIKKKLLSQKLRSRGVSQTY